MNNAKIEITFRHMDHQPVLDDYARKYIAKLEKFLKDERTPIIVELVLDAERTHHHHGAELRVKTPHYTLNAHKEGPDMYLLIEALVDAMCSELRRAKDRRVDTQQEGGFTRPR
jgi:ribosomal subunit interface protein